MRVRFFLLVVLLSVFAGCNPEAPRQATDTKPEPATETGCRQEGGPVVIKGSTTLLPITQRVAEAYRKEHPDARISISGGGSGNGIKALIDGMTDIANSSRFIENREVSLALEKGAYPVPFVVAYDCILPIVHPDNPVENITLDQLKAVYRGQILNWLALGGEDRKIVAISRDTSSGTYEIWEEVVMKKERVFPGALLQASNGAVVQAVSKNRNALGYISLGYLDEGAKALTVNGIPGNVDTAASGTFPITRPLYMFTCGWPHKAALDFIDYVLHPHKGQQIVAAAGYVPLY